MSDFAVVIGFKFENEEYRSIVLDAVDAAHVTGTSNVTAQPVVSGDMISDHMYNEPKTMSISGKISMNGSNVTVIDGEGSKLANFQELFERIQAEGVKCDIVKISMKNEDDIRFLHRHNMIIQSHDWTERINCLDYNLRFREVLTSEVTTFDVDNDDAFLPNITEPNTLSFTTTLINWEDIDTSIVKILRNNHLISDAFINALASFGEATLVAIVGVAIATVLVAVVMAGGPAGWIIGAIAIATAAVYIFVKAFINFFKKLTKSSQYLIDKFEWTNNSKKNNKELKRFGEFVKSIHDDFEQVNDLIHVYQIAQDTNQECMLGIGDDYYIFTFTKNNIDGKYGLKVEDVNGKIVASKTDVTTSPTSFDQLNNSNQLYIAKNNANVYMVYNPIVDSENTDETAEPDALNLRNYCIVVCDMNVEKFQKLVEDIIKAKILKNYA